VNETLGRLRELRHVLQRLGAQSVARYWSNESMVFASNFFGGAAAGAVAFVFAAVILGLDLKRGESSFALHLLRALQTMVITLRQMIEQELR
jgi:hypothetical protein